MYVEVFGTDWCHGCRGLRKFLMERDVPHTYNRLPPGQRGWEIAEEMTGRRAVPFTRIGGEIHSLPQCKNAVRDAGYRERPLTQHELDEID